eukprot:114966_1
MSVTEDEGVIIGSIVGITVLIIFGLVLWYCCSKDNSTETQYNPIEDDEYEPPRTHAVSYDLQTVNGTKAISETQPMLASEVTHQSNNEVLIDGETHANNMKHDDDNSMSDPQPNRNRQHVDATGIVVVDSTYQLEIAQTQTIYDDEDEEVPIQGLVIDEAEANWISQSLRGEVDSKTSTDEEMDQKMNNITAPNDELSNKGIEVDKQAITNDFKEKDEEVEIEHNADTVPHKEHDEDLDIGDLNYVADTVQDKGNVDPFEQDNVDDIHRIISVMRTAPTVDDEMESKANDDQEEAHDVVVAAVSIQRDIQNTGRTMNGADEAPIDRQIIAPTVDEKANEEVVDGAANEIQSTGEEDVDKGNVEVVVIDPSVPIVVQDDAHQEEEIDDAHSSGRTANESDEETDTKAKVAIVMNDDVKQADIDEVKMVNEADEVDTKANDDAVMSDDVALSGLNKEEVSDLLHRVLLEYNDSMEDDIKRIVNNKEIDGNALQEMVRKDNCNALASAFSILALDKTDWQKVYQSLKQMNEQQSIDI